MFPLEGLQDMAAAGAIGSVAPYSTLNAKGLTVQPSAKDIL